MLDPRLHLTHLLDRAGRLVKARTQVGDFGGGYDDLRGDFFNVLQAVALGFMEQAGRAVAQRKSRIRTLIADSFPNAFYTGYADAGGEETEPDDERWITRETSRQQGFVDDLFECLLEIKDAGGDARDEIDRHAEGFATALDSAYNEGKLRGNENIMLTFDGDDGQESCPECQRYKDTRHSAKWWLKRDLVRRNGNENFGCGRWQTCQHDLYTDKGERWTQ